MSPDNTKHEYLLQAIDLKKTLSGEERIVWSGTPG